MGPNDMTPTTAEAMRYGYVKLWSRASQTGPDDPRRHCMLRMLTWARSMQAHMSMLRCAIPDR